MASAQTITSLAITLAAVATLNVAACKKEPTTAPESDAAATDTANASDDQADEEVAAPDDSDDSDDAEPTVTPLNKANFDETINEHFSEVSDCYIAALEGNAELQGKLEAEFTIGGEGQVVSVVAVDGSTLEDEGLVACINSAASSWSFAVPADGEMTLRYSFDLAPG